MTTPLPAARPSALITLGNIPLVAASRAWRGLAKTSKAGVGMPFSRIRVLAKTLLPSMAAARALDQATQMDPRIEGVMSTKGKL